VSPETKNAPVPFQFYCVGFNFFSSFFCTSLNAWLEMQNLNSIGFVGFLCLFSCCMFAFLYRNQGVAKTPPQRPLAGKKCLHKFRVEEMCLIVLWLLMLLYCCKFIIFHAIACMTSMVKMLFTDPWAVKIRLICFPTRHCVRCH